MPQREAHKITCEKYVYFVSVYSNSYSHYISTYTKRELNVSLSHDAAFKYKQHKLLKFLLSIILASFLVKGWGGTLHPAQVTGLSQRFPKVA